jgi:hypothetical protein
MLDGCVGMVQIILGMDIRIQNHQRIDLNHPPTAVGWIEDFLCKAVLVS